MWIRAGTLTVLLVAHAGAAKSAPRRAMPASLHEQGGNMRAGPNPDWAAWHGLPDVDLGEFVPADRDALLSYARTECCDCGCGMVIAECHALMSWCPGAARQIKTAVEEFALDPRPERLVDAVETALPRRPPVDIGVGRLGAQLGSSGAGVLLSGPSGADVEMVLFADFRADGNAEVARLARAAAGQFPDHVRLLFKCLPNNSDPRSWLAAEAALAAAAQGKLPELSERMESGADRISRERILEWARELGLDHARLADALARREYLAAINQDVADARRIGLLTAPALLVNGRSYFGRPWLNELKYVIKSELQSARTRRAATAERR